MSPTTKADIKRKILQRTNALIPPPASTPTDSDVSVLDLATAAETKASPLPELARKETNVWQASSSEEANILQETATAKHENQVMPLSPQVPSIDELLSRTFSDIQEEPTQMETTSIAQARGSPSRAGASESGQERVVDDDGEEKCRGCCSTRFFSFK